MDKNGNDIILSDIYMENKSQKEKIRQIFIRLALTLRIRLRIEKNMIMK